MDHQFPQSDLTFDHLTQTRDYIIRAFACNLGKTFNRFDKFGDTSLRWQDGDIATQFHAALPKSRDAGIASLVDEFP